MVNAHSPVSSTVVICSSSTSSRCSTLASASSSCTPLVSATTLASTSSSCATPAFSSNILTSASCILASASSSLSSRSTLHLIINSIRICSYSYSSCYRPSCSRLEIPADVASLSGDHQDK
ncbi:unnamed protein product [Moneuplotes crassus]|uniref:Uncharacterized protein n=1 Tax=Euplotes crassus TaxID=5936 RepID=A0AAD1XWC4_EUPCR|nr:unnamed protein product [Moneuplotes crassus]